MGPPRPSGQGSPIPLSCPQVAPRLLLFSHSASKACVPAKHAYEREVLAYVGPRVRKQSHSSATASQWSDPCLGQPGVLPPARAALGGAGQRGAAAPLRKGSPIPLSCPQVARGFFFFPVCSGFSRAPLRIFQQVFLSSVHGSLYSSNDLWLNGNN